MVYHLEMGGMPLDDAVGVNWKMGVTPENQGAGAWYMAKGCVIDDCVKVI